MEHRATQATQTARGAGPRAIVISMHSHLPFPDSAGRGAGDERADVACAIAQGEVADAPPDRRLVVVFDSPVGRELVLLAPRLGWSVVVLEPDASRGGGPTIGPEVAEAGLDACCDVVVTDHDRPELGAVLARILTQPTRWIGVMGSLRHTAPHVAALTERGVAASDIARIHRPIGLDIGSRSPAEIAVATLAGLLADRNGRTGGLFAQGRADFR